MVKLVLVPAALAFSSMLVPGFQSREVFGPKAWVMFQGGVCYDWGAVVRASKNSKSLRFTLSF